MKKFLSLICIGLLIIGCAATPVAAPEPCEPVSLQTVEDIYGNLFMWIDVDCDGVCDFAGIAAYVGPDDSGTPTYVPVMKFSCEEGDVLLKQYREENGITDIGD